MASSNVQNAQSSTSAGWKTFVLVHKFVKNVKRNENPSPSLPSPSKIRIFDNSHKSNSKSGGGGAINVVEPGVVGGGLGLVNPTNPLVSQSITRQLAFGDLNRTTGDYSNQSHFYNGTWANILAKFVTIAVLLATIMLVTMRATKFIS